MKKTILITGSTDGLGFATAMMLLGAGQRVLIHGRSAAKLQKAQQQLFAQTGQEVAAAYLADLSDITAVFKLAQRIREEYKSLDVLNNNAGVYAVAQPMTSYGIDARFVVNMVAPYALTKALLPMMGAGGRVVNLSSAAQSPVNLELLSRGMQLPDSLAYAQSKLGVTMWTNALAAEYAKDECAPLFVSVNPKSYLATPMVRAAYGLEGSDVRVGADILCRAALSDEFAHANGKYFDNDSARFASPHPDALQLPKCLALVAAMDQFISQEICE